PVCARDSGRRRLTLFLNVAFADFPALCRRRLPETAERDLIGAWLLPQVRSVGSPVAPNGRRRSHDRDRSGRAQAVADSGCRRRGRTRDRRAERRRPGRASPGRSRSLCWQLTGALEPPAAGCRRVVRNGGTIIGAVSLFERIKRWREQRRQATLGHYETLSASE